MMDWIFDTNIKLDDYYGFVYLITNMTNGRLYIGKKTMWFSRMVVQKGKSRRKKIVKESDWRTYYGSSDELKEDVARLGTDKFKREILHFHKTKGALSYAEAMEQIQRDVLNDKDLFGQYTYYNKMINLKAYRR